MKKKFLTVILAVVAALCLCFGLAACGKDGGANKETGGGNNNSAHIHAYGNWEIVVPATHTTTGTRRKYCSCGEHIDETIPKTTAHEYGNWQTTREATHLVAGEKQRTCACGAVETDAIPKTTEHTFLSYSKQNATCTAAGEEVLRCECGEEQRNIIPQKSHTYDHCECTVCGAIEPGAIAVEVYIDNKLSDTLYTNAENGYKIVLPEKPRDWTVDQSILGYFDGWYTDSSYTTLATGDEEYHTPSAIYAQQILGGAWQFECSFSNNEATITKVNLKYGSTYATTIFIPRSINTFPITGIAGDAFKGQTTIRYLFLSDNLRTIGASAFSGCNSMLKVFFSEGLTSIGSSAFSGCGNIANVIWNAKDCSVGMYSQIVYPSDPDHTIFRDTNLGTVIFGEDVEYIPAYIFYNRSVTSVTIYNNVTSVGYGAFDNCSGLHVYYKGTPVDWNGISIYDHNSALINATRYYFSAQTPSAEQWAKSTNWWHYATDGTTIVLWTKEA